jgi:hypothetical protein
MLISQPFAALPSQFFVPLKQKSQALLEQEPVLSTPLHTFPQAPQLLALVLMLISQPSLDLALQFAVPAEH